MAKEWDGTSNPFDASPAAQSDSDDEKCMRLRAGQAKANESRKIANALSQGDWEGVSIGGKAIIQSAINYLNWIAAQQEIGE